MSRRLALGLLALAVLPGWMLMVSAALAAGPDGGVATATIREVHYSTTPKRLRVVFWMDRPVSWRLTTANQPLRVMVEVASTRFEADIRGYFIHNAVVAGMNARNGKDGTARVELRLKERVRPRAFLMNRGPGKVYLVVDLLRSGKSVGGVAHAEHSDVSDKTLRKAPIASRKKPSRDPSVRAVSHHQARQANAVQRRPLARPMPKATDTSKAGAGDQVMRFWALLQRMERLLRDMHGTNLARLDDVDRLFSMPCADIGVLAGRARALREEARASANDPGLDLEGGIRKGFDQTNSGLSSGSRQSAFIGLKWDFLRGGLLQHRDRSRWYELRAEKEDALARLEYHDRLNQCRADRIPDAFLPMRYRLLSLKTELLARLLTAYRQAYLRGGVFLEDVLQVEQELRAAGNDLSSIRARLAGFSREALLHPRMFPLLDVDMDAVMRAIDQDKLTSRATLLDADILAKKRENEKTSRLYAFLRYEANGTAFRNRGAAAGLRFSIPLFEDTTAGVAAYREASRARLRATLASRKRDARHAYRKFVEERERVIRQWYRFLRVMERLRRSRLEEEYNHWAVDTRAAAQRASEAIDAAIELERADELLYRRASEVFSYAHVLYRPGFVRVLPMADERWRERGGERAIYVWSKTFNAHSNAFLGAFLRAKQVDGVLLSVGKDVNRGKLEAFLAQARRFRLRVEPMFASNVWLSPEHYDEAVRRIRQTMRVKAVTPVRLPEPIVEDETPPPLQPLGGPAVSIERPLPKTTGAVRTGYRMAHLDVEPQALPRFKGDHHAQAKALIDLLVYLRRHLPADIRLSVSVPVFWDAGDYLRVANLADRLYLMDYGSSKPEVLLRRMDEVRLALPDDRLALALRASDFSSERELEHAIQVVRSRTGIRRFAIHALKGYLDLTDRNALEPGVRHGARQ